MPFSFLTVFGYIPSPSSDSFSIGPLTIRYYGVLIAAAALLLIWISIKRLTERGFSQDSCIHMSWIAVPAGLIGARIYHVITDWRLYTDDFVGIFKITQGGLGIPGAAIAIVIGVWIYAHINKLDKRLLLDTIVPFAPLAHAVGRLGNWFNQELFGRPSGLPWAVEIDRVNRPNEYATDATFHPYFLYEGLWNLVLMAGLLYAERQKLVKKGQMFAIYVLGYTSARVGLEFLRVDSASQFLGLRINVWVMSGFWFLALGWILFDNYRTKSRA